MPDWKDAPAADSTRPEPLRGVVRRPPDSTFRTCRYPPGARLEPWVDHLWSVDWDLRGRPPVSSAVITFPSMHLTAEWGSPGEVRHAIVLPATLVHGVVTRIFTVQLTGCGGVVGAAFRPGGFAAWAGVDASDYTDRRLPAEVFGASLARLHEQVQHLVDPAVRADVFRDLLERRTAPTAAVDSELAALVARISEDAALVRVEQLVQISGWSQRTLQRRFRRGIGVGPKWVLARTRLQEAALALEQDPQVDLAALAVRLGWYDQAHLTNDFRRMLGETPGQYAARVREASSLSSVDTS